MKSKAEWRRYKKADYAQVKALHEAMCIKVGEKWPFMDPAEEPIVDCIVLEEDGVITRFVALEAELEACHTGVGAVDLDQMNEAIEKFLVPTARAYKIQIVRSFVPSKLLEGKRNRESAIVRLLRKLGFQRENEMTQFYRRLGYGQDGR